MKKFIYLTAILLTIMSCTEKRHGADQTFSNEISKNALQDKIKGGWAGQVIGCTYGGPTEFRFNGTMIQDYHPIPWDENRCKWYYENSPGLYDDIYMDLTFVDVFEKEGLDAPASSHALAFAHADYDLWHANQAARYNILNGMMPPESGFWMNNPHSEDIDFQIEADFAGLMSPGMVNTASEICDKIGHIMNYGDGWYGGVYVAAMYSLAFISDDITWVVSEALKTIPSESQFHQCITDVIGWHKQFPNDWKQTWFECERKWSSDIGCPDGVFSAFNIDAKINAAYIVIGLLYGEGDYTKTIDISTRCGQDSDCNPASAGGILGTMLGYSQIPEYWKIPLYPVENLNFRYTTMSLNDVYTIGYKHALAVLEKNGADTSASVIRLPRQEIKPVALEIGFHDHFPVFKNEINQMLEPGNDEFLFNFEGNGFVVNGRTQRQQEALPDPEIEIFIDGQKTETFMMPAGFKERKHDVCWRFGLAEGKHEVRIKLISKEKCHPVRINHYLVYSSKQVVPN
ncbi:ADP-ribosylglycohydrolase family protein [Gaoshiqia sp. Z1-71]|uniref:ADP-ribosylglycohydrolase family protein n=1 Tax=Gaoshiqia hydrogeniformans TaxID=3290090 RepID=UPI003BF80911